MDFICVVGSMLIFCFLLHPFLQNKWAVVHIWIEVVFLCIPWLRHCSYLNILITVFCIKQNEKLCSLACYTCIKSFCWSLNLNCIFFFAYEINKYVIKDHVFFVFVFFFYIFRNSHLKNHRNKSIVFSLKQRFKICACSDWVFDQGDWCIIFTVEF